MNPEQASRDRWTAIALCLLLSIGWAIVHWSTLRLIWLPDTDDMMRLQQVRDLLAGQAWGDVSQHRLNPPDGLAMHWSRLADVPLFAILSALSSGLGKYEAALVAILVVPAMAFLLYLFGTIRLYRAIDDNGEALAPLVIASLAFPVIGLFLPGRIDHHGWQVALLVWAASSVFGRATVANGVITGMATAASLTIGLETAPLLAVLLGILAFNWTVNGTDERLRMIAVGGSLLAMMLVSYVMFIPANWPRDACDGFGPNMALIAGFAGLCFAFLGGVSGLSNMVFRGIVGAVLGGALLSYIWLNVPECQLDPYASVDPLVARHWLANVAEAKGLLALGLGRTSIGHAGLVITAFLVALVLGGVPGERRYQMLGLALLLAASLGLMLYQVRGAYGGAALAAIPLGLLINEIRARVPLLVIPAWLVSVGVLYDQLPRFVLPDVAAAKSAAAPITGECADALTMFRLKGMPKGRVIAPMDFGAYGVPATNHSFFAAPYHRNNRGNRLMYDILLDSSGKAASLSRQNEVRYVIVCPSAVALPAGSLGQLLASGKAPGWLFRIPVKGSTALIYRVR